MGELISAIDEYLLKQEGHPRESHYASDVSSCVRQLFYKWKNTTPSNPITASALWKMRMGNSIHSLVHEFLESAGYDIADEVALKKNYPGLKKPVSMRVDGIYSAKDGVGDIIGVEYKSTYGAGIDAVVRAGVPKREHAEQVCLYGDAYDIEQWKVIYIGRDNGYRHEFNLRYDAKERALFLDLPDGMKRLANTDQLIEKLVFIEDMVEEGMLPDRDYWQAIKNGEFRDVVQRDGVKYKTDWQCSYCQFRDMCWDEERKQYGMGLDNLDTKPDKSTEGEDE